MQGLLRVLPLGGAISERVHRHPQPEPLLARGRGRARRHICPSSCCRDVAHALERTFLISLLQPAPEVIQLFDDILLLTDGRVIYQ